MADTATEPTITVEDELTRIENAKASIATAITNKGVTVPSGTKLDGMAALIDSISGGGGGSSRYTVTISNTTGLTLLLECKQIGIPGIDVDFLSNSSSKEIDVITDMSIKISDSNGDLNYPTVAETDAFCYRLISYGEEMPPEQQDMFDRAHSVIQETADQFYLTLIVHFFYLAVDQYESEHGLKITFDLSSNLIDLNYNEVVFAQFEDGAWFEHECVDNGDGTFTVSNFVSAPAIIGIK